MGSVPRSQGLHTHHAIIALFSDDPQERWQQIVETKIVKVYIDLLSFCVLLRQKALETSFTKCPEQGELFVRL